MNKGKKKNNSASPIISIVVPVYKEERGIRPFLSRLESVIGKMGVPYEVIFALETYLDRIEVVTLEDINRNPAIKLLVFSRSFTRLPRFLGGFFNTRTRSH